MVFILILSLLFIIFILQAIAYLTLIERHVLGLTQGRCGPKKVGFYGILQPLVDGLKLLKKEHLIM